METLNGSGQLPGEDVLLLLTRQHRTLEALLGALLASEQRDETRALLGRIGDELAVHVIAEEQVFYPAVRARRTEDVLLESLEEHLSLKRLLADLLALPVDPGHGPFQAKCKVLEEQTRHHHQEEEEHLFPAVRRLLDTAARHQLGSEVLAHETALRAHGAPRQRLVAHTDAAAPLR